MTKRKYNNYSEENEELAHIFEDIANSFHRLSAFFKAKQSSQFGGLPTQTPTRNPPRRSQRRTLRNSPIAPRQYKAGYHHYTSEQRPILRKSFPETSLPGIVSLMNARWRNMTDNEKEKYEEMYRQDRDRYHRELKEYQQQMELLDELDTSDDDIDELAHDRDAANSESTDSEVEEDKDEESTTAAPLGVDFFSAFGASFGPAFGAPSADPHPKMEPQDSPSIKSQGDSDSDPYGDLEMDDSEGSSDGYIG